MKMEQTECSETSAYKIHTPGNYPEENIQHAEHDESLESRSSNMFRCKHHRYVAHYLSLLKLQLFSHTTRLNTPMYFNWLFY